ncbi:MAG: hypothetical protein D6731_09045 [Planctomycetota bacterium]|nr:MAG: hypothetical protein D6731_09045 [Planctomycetota bacterium]
MLLQGQVRDAAGRSVSGAQVALFWSERVGSLAASVRARTDADGRYRYTLHVHDGKPHALFAVGPYQETGGIAPIRSATVDIVLRPLVRVRGRVFVEPLGGSPALRTLTAYAGGARVETSVGGAEPFGLLLPPGRYRLAVRASRDHRSWEREVSLDGRRVEVDLGEVSLLATPLGRADGRRLPLFAPTEGPGVDPSRPGPSGRRLLGALRGRWVLVLAGDLRRPVDRLRLAGLVTFWQRHRDLRDRFAVLLLQARGPEELQELRTLLSAQAEALWGGGPLPFPLFLDGAGATLEAWGTPELPRVVLLDPDGLVVGGGDEATLVERLAR